MGAEVAFLGILDTTYSGSVRNLNSWVPSGLVIHISKDSVNFYGSSVHISMFKIDGFQGSHLTHANAATDLVTLLCIQLNFYFLYPIDMTILCCKLNYLILDCKIWLANFMLLTAFLRLNTFLIRKFKTTKLKSNYLRTITLSQVIKFFILQKPRFYTFLAVGEAAAALEKSFSERHLSEISVASKGTIQNFYR